MCKLISIYFSANYGFITVSFTSIGIILFSGGTGSLTVDLSVRPN